MSAQVLPIESVGRDPEIRGGRPVIAGPTLRVSDLAAYHTLAGLTPDQLAAQFDLDLAEVHGALAAAFAPLGRDRRRDPLELGPGRGVEAAVDRSGAFAGRVARSASTSTRTFRPK